MPIEFAHLETPRLFIRRFRTSDVEPFARYRADPVIARYQSWDSFSLENAIAFVSEQSQIVPNTPGVWAQLAIELKSSGTMIGDCAFVCTKDSPWEAQIGYTLAWDHQGKGFAQEALNQLLKYLFVDLEKHRVIASTDTRNKPSAKLVQRLGFRKEAHFIKNGFYKNEWCDEFVFALLREEFLTRS